MSSPPPVAPVSVEARASASRPPSRSSTPTTVFRNMAVSSVECETTDGRGSGRRAPHLRMDVDRGAVALLADLVGDVSEQAARRIVAEHQLGGAAVDARRARAGRQALGERGPDAAVLPPVGDDARHLGSRPIAGDQVVARDADSLAGRRVEGDEHLAGAMVDLRELLELAMRQAFVVAAEEPEARERPQTLEALRQGARVLR